MVKISPQNLLEQLGWPTLGREDDVEVYSATASGIVGADWLGGSCDECSEPCRVRFFRVATGSTYMTTHIPDVTSHQKGMSRYV